MEWLVGALESKRYIAVAQPSDGVERVIFAGKKYFLS